MGVELRAASRPATVADAVWHTTPSPRYLARQPTRADSLAGCFQQASMRTWKSCERSALGVAVRRVQSLTLEADGNLATLLQFFT